MLLVQKFTDLLPERLRNALVETVRQGLQDHSWLISLVTGRQPHQKSREFARLACNQQFPAVTMHYRFVAQ